MKRMIDTTIITHMKAGLKTFLAKRVLIKNYKRDANSIAKYSFLNRNRTINSSIAFILYSVHSIEKGLTNNSFRYGFGRSAIIQTIKALKQYESRGFSRENSTYISALSILRSYVDHHKSHNKEIGFPELYNFLDEREDIKIMQQPVCKKIFFEKGNTFRSFIDFASTRHSIRDYSDSKFDYSKINNSIRDANKVSPSSCNRRPWEIIVVRSEKLLKDIVAIQGGLRGFGKNTSAIICIMVSSYALTHKYERHEGFVNAGIFGMNLMYSLHDHGIASCPLNASMSSKHEKKLRRLLGIGEDLMFGMFISVGNYKELNHATISPVKEEILRWL